MVNFLNKIDEIFWILRRKKLSCTVFCYCNITESNKVGKPSSRATIWGGPKQYLINKRFFVKTPLKIIRYIIFLRKPCYLNFKGWYYLLILILNAFNNKNTIYPVLSRSVFEIFADFRKNRERMMFCDFSAKDTTAL